MKTLLALALFCSSAAQAAPSPFLEKLLADSDPTAFEVAPFATEDYALEWETPLKGATARLVPGSLQWVRVDELLVTPRALLEVEAPGQEGSLGTAGFTQPLANGRARLLVPLVSGEGNRIEVRAGSSQGIIRLRFKPRASLPAERIFFDPSCSRVRLSLTKNELPADTWAYIGCRQVRNHGEGVTRTDLDLLVFADNVGSLRIGGAEAPPVDTGRWNFRLTSLNRALELTSPRGALAFEARVAEKANRAFLGAGIGPYVYKLEKGTARLDTTVALPTLYSAYVLTGTTRLVFFAAVAAHKNHYSDGGLYFQFESFRAFDRRISLNLLLGAHAYAYNFGGTTTMRMNFPQGFEFFFFDVLGKARNASFGGFVQPPIDDKSYYNLWLRWGPASWFLEANYISADEPGFRIQTYGLSVGFPLLSFL